jgi:hypothetical protein
MYSISVCSIVHYIGYADMSITCRDKYVLTLSNTLILCQGMEAVASSPAYCHMIKMRHQRQRRVDGCMCRRKGETSRTLALKRITAYIYVCFVLSILGHSIRISVVTQAMENES